MSAYTHHGDCSTSDPCERCFEFGQTTEQARIIKLLKGERWVMPDGSPAGGEVYMPLEQAIALIKDPTRNITSEILPDGSIHIEEIKGETK